jgi:AraC-like DNA-binding protein
MDALSDVLRAAQLSGGVFLHAEFAEPWCLLDRLEADQCGPFLHPVHHLIHYHFVVEGSMRFQIEGQPEKRVHAGEVVLLPHNHSHLLGSDLSLPPAPGGEIIQPPVDGGLATIQFGGEGKRTRLICGYLGSEGVDENPVLGALPPFILMTLEGNSAADWIRSTFHYAAHEVAAGRPGSETVLAKLSELLFVEAVRGYLEEIPDEQTGWLAGLKDPYVSQVLALLHGDCARSWTVEDLGREVGLSRSALADRFTRIIGSAPIQYLSQWRMQIASQRLRTTHLSLAQIGEQTGYDSEAAFSRAFKKTYGTPPATWRRQQMKSV